MINEELCWRDPSFTVLTPAHHLHKAIHQTFRIGKKLILFLILWTLKFGADFIEFFCIQFYLSNKPPTTSAKFDSHAIYELQHTNNSL